MITIKVTGVICEYNPFHKGHEYHLSQARQNADFCICVMSGAFVQRGTPAMLDKWTRAKTALMGGADLVIELPTVFALSSAEMFGYGAVSLLDRLNVVTDISFGSSSNIDELKSFAEISLSEPAEFKINLNALLADGLSYPNARATALADYMDNPNVAECLNDPNNVLGVEYIKALLRLNSPIIPNTILRKGATHNDNELGEFCSSTAIRNAINSDNINAVYESMPEYSAQALRNAHSTGAIVDNQLYSLMGMYALRSHNKPAFANIPDVAEGLENRLIASLNASSLEEFIQMVKTKRYTRTRLNRIIARSILRIDNELLDACNYTQGASYARILGFKKSASPLLKAISTHSEIPVIQSVKDSESTLEASALTMLNVDLRANEVQSLCMRSADKRKGGTDYTHPLVII